MSYPIIESNWNDYQSFVTNVSSIYAQGNSKIDLAIRAMGLSGECQEMFSEAYQVLLRMHSEASLSTGSISENIKKYIRDNNVNRDALILELGDMLAYIALVADMFDIRLSTVMEANEYKLAKRQAEYDNDSH